MSLRPSPLKRGMMCRCGWSTTCPACSRLFIAMLTPSALSACSMAIEITRAASASVAQSSGAMSKNVERMFFRYNERVPGIDRPDVEERERIFVLIHFVGGKLTADYFAENAVAHAGSIQYDHVRLG